MSKKKTEIDIYLEVLEKEGFVYHDEYSRFGNENYMNLYHKKSSTEYTNVYFNYKTGLVSSISLAHNLSDKFKEKVKQSLLVSKRSIHIDNVLSN